MDLRTGKVGVGVFGVEEDKVVGTINVGVVGLGVGKSGGKEKGDAAEVEGVGLGVALDVEKGKVVG